MLEYRKICLGFNINFEISTYFKRLAEPCQKVADVGVGTFSNIDIQQTFFLQFVKLFSFLHNLAHQVKTALVIKQTQA